MLFDDKCYYENVSNAHYLWSICPKWLEGYVQAHKSANVNFEAAVMPSGLNIDKGTAIIPINGPMIKGKSFFFFGAATTRIRALMNEAVKDKSVDNILLHIDSPGGMISGTNELAEAVRSANKVKPVIAHIDDLGASAAFWVASQAGQVFANKMAEVGSIGTLAVVVDSSKAAEKEGFEVHVVSTGKFKGSFVSGAPVEDFMLEELQTRVEEINDFFLKAVSKGRNMSIDAVRKVADGRLFMAKKAVDIGLIDGVQSVEKTFAMLQKGSVEATSNLKKADALLRLAELNS